MPANKFDNPSADLTDKWCCTIFKHHLISACTTCTAAASDSIDVCSFVVALCSDDIDDCNVSDSVFAVTVVSNCLVVAPAANRGMLPVSPYYSVRKFFWQMLHPARHGLSEQQANQDDKFGLLRQSLRNIVFLTHTLATVVVINYS